GSELAEDRRIDGLEVAFLFVFATVVVLAWLGLTLAEWRWDRPLVVLPLGVVGTFAAGVIVVRRTGWYVARPPVVDVAGLLVPLAIGVALFFPPDEWILGDLDPGSYVNAGALIAQSGGIATHDPLLAAMDPTVRATLYPFPASRLPGLYLTTARFAGLVPQGWEVPADRVVPHGFHLYPAVLAFGWAVGGIRAELLVTPLLALLGLAGFYLLARRLFRT